MLEILYEDNSCIVVSKPAGLFSQAAHGIDSALVQLTDLLDKRRSDGRKTFLRLVHRLDRGTSGCLLLAKNQRAAKQLSAQFAARSVKKMYWAIVESGVSQASAEQSAELDDPHGRLVDYVRKIENEPRAEVISEKQPDARLAELEFKRLAVAFRDAVEDDDQVEPRRFFEIQLKTGRMHQIRVQFAARGWPVVGDTMYGPKTQTASKYQSDVRLGLHAVCLGFRHPKTAKPITIAAPLPEHWKNLMGAAHWWQGLQELWNQLSQESTKPNDGS